MSRVEHVVEFRVVCLVKARLNLSAIAGAGPFDTFDEALTWGRATAGLTPSEVLALDGAEPMGSAQGQIAALNISARDREDLDTVIGEWAYWLPMSDHELSMALRYRGRPERAHFLPTDLDGDRYSDDSIGPWKVTSCCGAYVKGVEHGVVCRSCFQDASGHPDGPARLAVCDPAVQPASETALRVQL